MTKHEDGKKNSKIYGIFTVWIGNEIDDKKKGNLCFFLMCSKKIFPSRLKEMPECLRGSPSLEILMAGGNKISSLDVSLVASWQRIATLHLNNNDISFLPPLLGNCTQIR